MIRPADLAAVRALRLEVLRPGQPADTVVYPQDPDAVHLGAFDERGRLVGCVTVFPDPTEDEPAAWRLRGMATHPSVRGHGYGAALLQAAVEAVRAAGAPLLWCNARVTALDFYRRHGFVPVGPTFVIPGGGPHFRMRRPLVGAAGLNAASRPAPPAGSPR